MPLRGHQPYTDRQPPRETYDVTARAGHRPNSIDIIGVVTFMVEDEVMVREEG